MKRTLSLLLAFAMMLSMGLTASAANIKYYEKYPALPDFGAYANLMVSHYEIEGVDYYAYVWSPLYSEADFAKVATAYFSLLEDEGFTVANFDSGEEAIGIYSGKGLYVALTNREHSFYITVSQISNASENSPKETTTKENDSIYDIIDKEPNDSISSAQETEPYSYAYTNNDTALFSGKIDAKGYSRDIDYYKFTLTSESYVNIFIRPEKIRSDWNLDFLGLDLYDSSGNLLCHAKTEDSSPSKYGNREYYHPWIVALFPAGTYYISVGCKYGDSKYQGAEYYGCLRINQTNTFGVISLAGLVEGTPSISNRNTYANFKKIYEYNNQFSDVNTDDWYLANVATVYDLGLMNGDGGAFRPSGNITIAEALALACRLHSIYNTGGVDFKQENPWYQTYVDYAIINHIIGVDEWSTSKENRVVTRLEFATLMYNALPIDAWSRINDIDTIPDLLSNYDSHEPVFALYRAGILTGSDAQRSFKPDSNIQRSEVATIISRIAIPNLRVSF